MSLFKIARVAVAAAAAMFASQVFADTATLNVAATVTGTCKFFSTPYAGLSFTLDPSVGGDKTSTQDVVYKCTKNSSPPSFTVAADGDGSYSSTMTSAGTDTIPFTITWTPPASNPTGFSGSGVTITLTGTVTESNYLDVAAGNYSKSGGLTLSITP